MLRSFAKLILAFMLLLYYKQHMGPDTDASLVAPTERVGNQHPIQVLLAKPDIQQKLTTANSTIKAISSHIERQSVIRKEYLFLADELTNLGPFPLDAQNIKTIWQSVVGSRLFEDTYQRTTLASLISLAYAVAEFPANSPWKDFPRMFMRDQEIPYHLNEDKEGKAKVRLNLEEAGTAFRDDPPTDALTTNARDSFGNGTGTIITILDTQL